MSKILILVLVTTGLVISPLSWSGPAPRWTLGSSIQRALQVAPEMKMAQAEIGKQQGRMEQAGAWPNPSVSLQVDDKLGIEDAAGGYDLTQLAISQPLPLGRLSHQRQQAGSALASAQAQHRYQQLQLEFTVARRFHTLQLAEAKLQLAKRRLQQAGRYHDTDHGQTAKDPLVRYLTPLERMRLDIVHQNAKQAVDITEGEYNEIAASFKALLDLPVESELSLMALTSVPTPAGFNALENAQQHHPALMADKLAVDSAQAGIEVAKAERFADPTLTLFQETDILAGRRQDATGIMLSIQVPLWNLNNGRVNQARYTVQQAQAELDLKRRNIRAELHNSYLHLKHLIDQAEHYRNKLREPAKQVFKLTSKGFEAGELNILSLIDANNTYFEVQERYLELLQQGWLELAMLRKSAGLSLTANSPVTHFDGVN